MADVVLELGRRVVVNFVGVLENGMGATHFGRFVLVGRRASIVDGSVAALLRWRRSWSARTRKCEMTADSCSGVRAVGARGMRAEAGSVLFLMTLAVEVLIVVEVLGAAMYREECWKGRTAF